MERSVSDQITRCTRCRTKLIKRRFGKRWLVVQERRRKSRSSSARGA